MNLRNYLICRIIFTFLFLITSTIIWFTRSNNIYHEVQSDIISNKIIISDLKRLNESDDKTYNLKIENKDTDSKDFKVYIVPNIIKESVSNNYIKYQVNDNSIKTLNMDGMIVVSKLNGLSEMNINLKIWISDTYPGDLNYDGMIIVS